MSNGDRYYGRQVKDGKPDLKGIVYSSQGYYEGDLKNGKPHGEGTYFYFQGNKFRGSFYEDKFLVENKGLSSKKINEIPTLLIRSDIVHDGIEENELLYEKHKFQQEKGKLVEVKVVNNSNDVIEAIEEHSDFKDRTDETSFRLVIDQHSGLEDSDLDIDKNSAMDILKKIINRGFKDIRISSLSCNVGEAIYFYEAAQELTKENGNVEIRIRSNSNYKGTVSAYEGNDKMRKLITVGIDRTGDAYSRKKTVISKGEKKITAQKNLSKKL